MRIVSRTLRGLAAFALLGSSGCLLSTIRQSNQDAVARGQAAQALARTDLFVTATNVWFCPEVDQAKLNVECTGGKLYGNNQSVTVIGQAPEDGVWKSEIWDAQGSHPGFVMASALAELPDLSEFEAFVQGVEQRYSVESRIPVESVNYMDLVLEPEAFADRFLVIRERSGDMEDKEFVDGHLEFKIVIPGMRGSKQVRSVAQFDFANPKLVDRFQSGETSYRCGPAYCDEFLIVARLAGTVETVDPTGRLYRLPRFEVVELGDRYDTYSAP